jgi:CheY-like chemotaxis protein
VLVQSEVGRGTTFRVLLPADRDARLPRRPSDRTAPRGGGRVLVMDDDPAVRSAAVSILEHAGFEVTCVAEGAGALDAYRVSLGAGRPFDVVILDLTVPGGMGGRETLGRLLELDAGVRVLVSSGYSEDSIMTGAAERGVCGVLPKPYRAAELCDGVLRAMRVTPTPD